MTRRWFAALALALVVLVTAWGGRVVEGRRAVAASDVAAKRSDRVEAIAQARAAAEARCPWCAAPDLGYARLYAIAKEAEGQGDDAMAVACWRAVRAATLATVVVDTAPGRRQAADAEIARLEHRLDARAAATGAPSSPAASEERLRTTLGGNVIPSGMVFLLLAFGGALFLRGAIGLARAPRFRVLDTVLALVGAAAGAAGVLFF